MSLSDPCRNSRRVSFNNIQPSACSSGSVANPTEFPQHTPPSANVNYVYNNGNNAAKKDLDYGFASAPMKSHDLEHMYSFSFGKEKKDPTKSPMAEFSMGQPQQRRERYKLPPAPSRGILKAYVDEPPMLVCRLSPGESPSLDHALDQETSDEESDDEPTCSPSFSPQTRKKSIAEMTPEEIMALDSVYDTRRKVDIEGMKFDHEDNSYFMLSAAAGPAVSEQKQKEAIAAKLEGLHFGDTGYPTRPVVDYGAITLTQEVSLGEKSVAASEGLGEIAASETSSLPGLGLTAVATSPLFVPVRKILCVLDERKLHLRRPIDWYFHNMCQSGDHFIVVESADSIWGESDRHNSADSTNFLQPPETKPRRRSSAGNELDDYISRTSGRRPSATPMPPVVPEARRASTTARQVRLLETHAAALLQNLVGYPSKNISSGSIRITVEIADISLKDTIRRTTEIYEPHLLLIGDKSKNLNHRFISTVGNGDRGSGTKSKPKRIVGLARYVMLNCQSCPVIVVGRDASWEDDSPQRFRISGMVVEDDENAIVLDDELIRSDQSEEIPESGLVWSDPTSDYFTRMVTNPSDISYKQSMAYLAPKELEPKAYTPTTSIQFASDVKQHDATPPDLARYTSRASVHAPQDKMQRVKSLLAGDDDTPLSKQVSASSSFLRAERSKTNTSSGNLLPIYSGVSLGLGKGEATLQLPNYGASLVAAKSQPDPLRRKSTNSLHLSKTASVDGEKSGGLFKMFGFGKKTKK
ncbi:hypothetical protein BABINDRAFT_160987, partial [Babjeviella inositovora NRRL Y-12698]